MLHNYDAKNNVLHISKPPVEKKKLRGFIVTIANNQEELEAIQKGENKQFSMSPVLAENEKNALSFIEQQGKIAISIANLELLTLQVQLLVDLASSKNIELIQEDIFKVKQI